jgi:hypothetical protein
MLPCAEREGTRLLPYLGTLAWALGKTVPNHTWPLFAAVVLHVKPWRRHLALPVDVLVLLLWGIARAGVRHAGTFREVKRWLSDDATLSKMSDHSIALLLQACATLQLLPSVLCSLYNRSDAVREVMTAVLKCMN